MHLSDEQLQRVLHGEDPKFPESTARTHLDACDACAARLEAARRDEAEILQLLRGLDRDPPALTVDTIVAAARRRASGEGRHAPDSLARSWRNRAAAILAAVTLAGVAYAAPGSPLPAFVRRVTARITGQSGAPLESAPPRTAGEPTSASSTAGGMKFTAGARFTILFETTGPSDTVTVGIVDGAELTVRVPPGAAISSPSDETVVVHARSSDSQAAPSRFEIDVPRTARHVEIIVRNRRVFLSEHGAVRDAFARDTAGRLVIPLGRPGS